MHPCKAPGPDGMHAIFYQRLWHIVGDGVTKFVSDIIHGFSSPASINDTNIALIPKVKEPSRAAMYRLIASVMCSISLFLKLL